MGYMITTNIIHKQPNIPEFTKYPLAHPVQTPTAQIARILQICAPSPSPPFPSGLTNPQPAIPEYTPDSLAIYHLVVDGGFDGL